MITWEFTCSFLDSILQVHWIIKICSFMSQVNTSFVKKTIVFLIMEHHIKNPPVWDQAGSKAYSITPTNLNRKYPPSLHVLTDLWTYGFSGANKWKFANARNRGRVLFILDNRKLRTLHIRTIMASYGWKWSFLLLWIQMVP